MGPIRIGLVVVAALGAAAAAWYFWPSGPEAPAAPAPVVQAPPAPAPEPAVPEHYPVPENRDAAPPATPLPALDGSDSALQEGLAGVLGTEALQRIFNLESLVRHIVATVDNLPRKSFAQRLSPFKPVGGLMLTTGKDESLTMAPENAARYAPWVAVTEKVDAKKLVALYVRFYPLFQQAYVELGYPKGHFNTRLVQVIDHLLTAPEPGDFQRLAVPHVLYEYADPALENESSGRKVLFRMGHANAAKVKTKLREIRRELVKAR